MFIKLTTYIPSIQVSFGPDYEVIYIKADSIESIECCETHSAVHVKNDANEKYYLVKETPEEIIKMIEEMKK